MEITISPELLSLVPGFKMGIIIYKDIEVGSSPQMLRGRLQLFQESLYFDLEEKQLSDLKGISEWRSIFKKTGKDPNRYRHSAEALYRRVKKQNYIQSINSATDLNNFLSLKYEIPLGIYDLSHLNGDIIISIGTEDEEYEGLNGRSNSLHQLIISSDEKGGFGSPYVDSVRSAVTEATRDAIHLIYLRPSLTIEEGELLTESVMNMFTQIHGGVGECQVIGE
ncbi:phenylalanine--tRNA ligase beta subunit-related protein [Robertmurraya korlensis]|uniref:B3/B4 domain-containing protein n=1 Tax=Robertmurraya korlensis TaxID=519977 RepID=UPI00204038C0|nr:phenylalanine--tRNA ligase beta subunit-related protein [Robertmurraya korlensis]MCM3603605.1 phenylalanine--tRNA ligase beta subunit-related protein [Robertmurraya korlensis]